MFSLISNVNNLLVNSRHNSGLKYEKIMQQLVDDLLTQIEFIDFHSCLEIIQMSALLGILPLECFEFSTLKGNKNLKGDCFKFMRTASVPTQSKKTKENDKLLYQNIFDTVIRESNQILPTLKVSKSFAENAGSEIWRIFIQFLHDQNITVEYFNDLSESKKHNLFRKCFDENDKELFNKHCGSSDRIYIDNYTCRNRPVQPCFRVLQSTSSPVLQMCTHILNEDDGTHHLESIKLTGWYNYEQKEIPTCKLLKSMKMNKELIKWEGSDLKIDEDIQKLFLPVLCFKSNDVETCCPACTTCKMMFRKRTRGYKYESIAESSGENCAKSLRNVLDKERRKKRKIHK